MGLFRIALDTRLWVRCMELLKSGASGKKLNVHLYARTCLVARKKSYPFCLHASHVRAGRKHDLCRKAMVLSQRQGTCATAAFIRTAHASLVDAGTHLVTHTLTRHR